MASTRSRSLPPLLGRRMEALPCIYTTARRWVLPFASSTRPVRLVGGELEGGVAPIRSPPPFGPRMEVPPLHLHNSGKKMGDEQETAGDLKKGINVILHSPLLK